MRTFGTWSRRDIHWWVVLLHTSPKLTTSATQNIELNTAALAETHDDEMAVGTSLRVVAHLRLAIHGALVRRDTPSFAAIHCPVLYILVSASIWIVLGVELVAHFADCLDDMAWIGRCGSSRKEVVIFLALVGLELFELWTVLEFGANGGGSGSVEKGRKGYPGYHDRDVRVLMTEDRNTETQ